MASASAAAVNLPYGSNMALDQTSDSNTVIDLTVDTSDSEQSSVMNKDTTKDGSETINTKGKKGLISVVPSGPGMTADISDSELSSAMEMETTEDEMEKPKATGSMRQGFASLTRESHTTCPAPGVPKETITVAGATGSSERKRKVSETTNQHFPTRARRNAISPLTPQPLRVPRPPGKDGISILLNAATVPNPSPPSEDGITLILRAAALMERALIPCTSDRCPITHPHGEGLYQHPTPVPNSELANIHFAPGMPPPHVVQAFNNLVGNPVNFQDANIKARFFAYHTAPCRESEHLKKALTSKCNSQYCGVEGKVHLKGIYLHEGFDASHSLAAQTHRIFGISSPPPKIWEAALRLEKGEWMEGDRDAVDDFCAFHGWFEAGTDGLKELKIWQNERRKARNYNQRKGF
ncbi:MAG: hypothetical protein Q9218_005994 [Villophora microphyllina]